MNPTQLSGGELTAIIAICLFAIIFFVTRRALAESSLGSFSQFVVSICVSVLAIIGMMDTFGGPGGGFHPLLVPFESMAFSILLSPVVLAIVLFLRFLGFGRLTRRAISRVSVVKPPPHEPPHEPVEPVGLPLGDESAAEGVEESVSALSVCGVEHSRSQSPPAIGEATTPARRPVSLAKAPETRLRGE